MSHVDSPTALPASISNSAGKGGSGYIFDESEFEGSSFHAAAFVAKYRRVTSLESVRDQLRGYMQTVKDQVISELLELHIYVLTVFPRLRY
jgi:hypothetical protein